MTENDFRVGEMALQWWLHTKWLMKNRWFCLSSLLTANLIILCLVMQVNLPSNTSLAYTRGRHPDSKQAIQNEWLIESDFTYSACPKKNDFVYIKMIKCASTTLATMFRHYGYIQNLSFVLPVGNKIYLGWPYLIQSDFYRPLKTGSFNILTEHVVYNYHQLSSILPSNSVYITSIREPYSQFKSMFNYYNLAKIMGITGEDPVTEYLSDIEHYEAVYKSHRARTHRFCIPDGFSMSKNLMAFNLGFPTGFNSNTSDLSNDMTFVKKWLAEIDGRFALVLIVEYLYESLVLLRRLMCWSLRDVLHLNLNVAQYSHPLASPSLLRQLYKRWSPVDHILYHHFNTSLWNKLDRQKEDFWQEVDYYRSLTGKISQFCHGFQPGSSQNNSSKTLTIATNQWISKLVITQNYCNFLKSELLVELKDRYDANPFPVIMPTPSKTFC